MPFLLSRDTQDIKCEGLSRALLKRVLALLAQVRASGPLLGNQTSSAHSCQAPGTNTATILSAAKELVPCVLHFFAFLSTLANYKTLSWLRRLWWRMIAFLDSPALTSLALFWGAVSFFREHRLLRHYDCV
jgi:hypothetical protein